MYNTHVMFQGDSVKAASWLGYAKRLLRALPDGSNNKRSISPVPKVRITVWKSGEFDYILIKVKEDRCRDADGFLCVPGRYSVDKPTPPIAYYNDGTFELFDVWDDDPDNNNCDRTCAVGRGPLDLAWTLFLPYPSEYTGLMRQVVQCEYMRGVYPKFRNEFNVTHGIIEWPQTRQIGADAAEEEGLAAGRRHWLVEISREGVYALEVPFGTSCCATTDSHSLSQYVSTAIGSANKIDLATSYVKQENPDNESEDKPILQLLNADDVVPIYNLGGALYDNCGWAFSYSGHEAQNVLFASFNQNGVEAKVSRAKFTFAFDEYGVPFAGTSVVEEGLDYSPDSANTIWYPNFTKYQVETVPVNPSNILDEYDVPVHVFYVGDTECVMRIRKSIPEGTNPSGRLYEYFYDGSPVTEYEYVNFSPSIECENGTDSAMGYHTKETRTQIDPFDQFLDVYTKTLSGRNNDSTSRNYNRWYPTGPIDWTDWNCIGGYHYRYGKHGLGLFEISESSSLAHKNVLYIIPREREGCYYFSQSTYTFSQTINDRFVNPSIFEKEQFEKQGPTCTQDEPNPFVFSEKLYCSTGLSMPSEYIATYGFQNISTESGVTKQFEGGCFICGEFLPIEAFDEYHSFYTYFNHDKVNGSIKNAIAKAFHGSQYYRNPTIEPENQWLNYAWTRERDNVEPWQVSGGFLQPLGSHRNPPEDFIEPALFVGIV